MNSTPSETPVDLTGQVALVTGGGRGLGRAFALALAAAGAQVAVTARTAAQLAEDGPADPNTLGGAPWRFPAMCRCPTRWRTW